MSTPNFVVDTDIHPEMEPARVVEFLAEPWKTRYRDGNRSAGGVGWWNPGGVNRADAVLEDGSRIERNPQALARHHLDVHGLDYGVLIPGGPLALGLSPEAVYAAAVIAAHNDVMAEDWLTADPRYRASIVVYPNDAELAVREIHRWGEHPGFVQVIMCSGARVPYGQRMFHPIYEAAAHYGLPVAIHPGTEGVGISGPPTAAGYPTSYLEWHTDLVGSYIAHLVSLVTEGVFAKTPTLRFVLIEGGVSWLPPILWRLDKNWKALRMTVPWVDRLPSEIIQEHVLLTTQPIEEPDQPEHLSSMLSMFDAANMLMFSTDYPHWDGDTPDFTARFVPAEIRAAVMGENAARLYQLPVPQPVPAHG